jgi:hypothetical protein
MNGAATPELVHVILECPRTWPIACFAPVAYCLVSGLSKIADFRGAVAEMAQAGMLAPIAVALPSTFAGSGSVLACWGPHRDRPRHRLRFLGGFKVGALKATAVFPVHFGLIAAFVLDAVLAGCKSPTKFGSRVLITKRQRRML